MTKPMHLGENGLVWLSNLPSSLQDMFGPNISWAQLAQWALVAYILHTSKSSSNEFKNSFLRIQW